MRLINIGVAVRKRNRYVADMQVERSTSLPAPEHAVRDALLDPELLSAWLGEWTPDTDGAASVLTDDGVRRRVSGHRVDDDGNVRWTWWAEDGSTAPSEVVVELSHQVDATRLVVRETSLTASPSQPVSSDHSERSAGASCFAGSGSRWTACLLALGAVLEQRRSLVTV